MTNDVKQDIFFFLGSQSIEYAARTTGVNHRVGRRLDHHGGHLNMFQTGFDPVHQPLELPDTGNRIAGIIDMGVFRLVRDKLLAGAIAVHPLHQAIPDIHRRDEPGGEVLQPQRRTDGKNALDPLDTGRRLQRQTSPVAEATDHDMPTIAGHQGIGFIHASNPVVVRPTGQVFRGGAMAANPWRIYPISLVMKVIR